VPFDGVREALEALMQTARTRVVIVTGRTVEHLVPLLGIHPPPEIYGAHGWEHLSSIGEWKRFVPDEQSLAALLRARAWIEAEGLGEHSEFKAGSVTFHWRGMEESEAQALREKTAHAWAALAMEANLELHDFDGGMELRARARHKGIAVREVLKSAEKMTPAAFLGDDLTDEDAFKELKGRGLSVLVRGEPRATSADVWIRPPDELLDFLARWRNLTK
jgi:trehalose-phosphatase